MRVRNDKTVLVFAVFALFALYGAYSLLTARGNYGDLFPPYSTYRTDPQGAKVLYESLKEIPQIAVRRNSTPLSVLEPNRAMTLFVLGDSLPFMNQVNVSSVEAIESFMSVGGRVVITFPPQADATWSSFWLREEVRDSAEEQERDAKKDEQAEETEEAGLAEESEKDSGQPGRAGTKTEYEGRTRNAHDVFGPDDAEKEDTDGEEEDSGLDPESRYQSLDPFINLANRWGIDFGLQPLEQPDGGDFIPARAMLHEIAPLPAALDWHRFWIYQQMRAAAPRRNPLPSELEWYSALHFKDLTDAWRVIYSRDGFPVVIERSYGNGSLVFASDTYLLSNEALRRDPQADLVAWFVGASRELVFDETHLGIVEQGGVMSLARKYRLHGTIVACIILAVLLVWQNAFSLAPPHGEDDSEALEGTEGREAIAGLQNLLRRHVPSRTLIQLCVDEWKKSQPQGGRSSAVAAAVDRCYQQIQVQGATHPVAQYKALAQEVNARKRAVLGRTSESKESGDSKPAA
ncbi:MAG: hypothetical protein AMXMBFR84_48710 [Candidatus Hydrogenedentota bacterium]